MQRNLEQIVNLAQPQDITHEKLSCRGNAVKAIFGCLVKTRSSTLVGGGDKYIASHIDL